MPDAGRARRLKLWHIATVSEFHRFAIMRDLVDLQQDFDVTAVCSDGDWVDDLRKAGLRVVTVPIARKIAPFGDLISLKRLVQLLGREKPDLVHTHTPKAGLLGQLAARITGVPIRLNSIRGYCFTPQSPWAHRILLHNTERVASALSQRVLFLSDGDRQRAVATRMCPAEKAFYIGSGIDLGRFEPATVRRDELTQLRVSLGIPADSPVVGIVGRPVREKGYEEFFRAAAVVSAQFPRARFLAVGDVVQGDREAVDFGLGTSLGLDGVVVRTGHRMDMPALYSLMDVLVLPSYREGVPRVLMEAAAMGRAIVASDIPGCAEVIEHDRSGILVPVRDHAGLADAILRFLKNPDLRKGYGDAARRRTVERFDDRALVTKIRTHYRILTECRVLGS